MLSYRSLPLVVLVVLAVLISGCNRRITDTEQVNPQEKIVIKFSHVVAENTPKDLAARRFADLVRQRTGGRVEVQVYPNSKLYKDGEEMDALENGAVQMIAPSTAKLGERYPPWQVFDLPYAFRNENQVHRAMDGAIGQKLFALLKGQKIHPLALWDNGFKQITNSSRPLVHPRDFQGLTFRVMINSRVLEEQFRRLGAHPSQLPFSDLYLALAGQAVDGQENTMSNIYSQRFYEVQPYLTVSNHGYLCYVVLTNTQFWASLPPAIRKTLEDTLAEVTRWEQEQAAVLNAQNYEQIKAAGKVRIHIQTPGERKEWEEVLAPLYRQFAPVFGPELTDDIQKLRKES